METITGHVKLAGRANKNNYRAIARLRTTETRGSNYLWTPASLFRALLSSLLLLLRAERVKKRRRKGRGRKERGEGKESSEGD